ncbi:MAG: prolyl-tRNA synthetase associated domain-containing protein [Lachnospira sp.]|nr:prolyl-tRNA synthetase associated domain-containing protein [Lachnospira sp.]
MAAQLILQHGHPCDSEGRFKVELAVYDLLDSLNIEYDRVDHEAAFTMEACEAIDKVLMPALICKNLFLCNAQKTKFYLLMIPGDKKFKTKDISHQINSSRLSFAPEEFMEKYLGVASGSVSVMGLMNDHGNQVTLLIDEDVLRADYFGCHPCMNTSSIRLKMDDLLHAFLPAVHHDYMVVRL